MIIKERVKATPFSKWPKKAIYITPLILFFVIWIPTKIPTSFYTKSYSLIHSKLRPQLRPETTRIYKYLSQFHQYYRPFHLIWRIKEGLLSKPEVLNIHMSFKNYQLLHHRVRKVHNSKNKRITKEDKAVEVKATLIVDKKEYPAKVKLKGTALDHIMGDKWSFKIKLRGKRTLWGMRNFSIHNPGARSYIFEWIIQQAARTVDLLHLRYNFIKVKLNGKDLGVYAVEEFFDKQLVENNKRREGPLVKPFNTELRLLKASAIKKKKHLERAYLHANEIYKKYIEGKISPQFIFDYDKTAKYFAISELFGGHHSNQTSNFVAYLNPITGLLTPITYDNNACQFLPEQNGMFFEPRAVYGLIPNIKLHPLFSDINFFKLYLKYVRQFSNDEFINTLFASIGNKQKSQDAIIHSEYPTIYLKFDEKRKWVDAYKNYIQDLVSHHISPNIEKFHTRLIKKLKNNLLNIPKDKAEVLNLIKYRVPNFKKFNFLRFDKEKKTIQFNIKNVTITKTLIIPKGLTLIIPKGVTIELAKDASLISYSKVYFSGTKKEPILIKSKNGNSGGVFILLARGTSKVEFTTFKELRTPKIPGRAITSGIMFHESDVEIHNSHFYKNLDGDDLLNIVRSNILIKNSSFNQSISDAVDLDFCTGALENLIFNDSGNDSLDVSGSTLTISNFKINNAGDKGISVGEASNISGSKIIIDGSKVGIATKDASKTSLTEIDILNSDIGAIVFRKKSEYGPAFMNLEKVTLSKIKNEYYLEKRSDLFINSVKMLPNVKNKFLRDSLYEKE